MTDEAVAFQACSGSELVCRRISLDGTDAQPPRKSNTQNAIEILEKFTRSSPCILPRIPSYLEWSNDTTLWYCSYGYFQPFSRSEQPHNGFQSFFSGTAFVDVSKVGFYKKNLNLTHILPQSVPVPSARYRDETRGKSREAPKRPSKRSVGGR